MLPPRRPSPQPVRLPASHNFLLRLNELVRAAASMPTSRTIIFISDGFNRFPGRELYGIVQGFAPRDHSFWFPSRDTEPELQSIQQRFAEGHHQGAHGHAVILYARLRADERCGGRQIPKDQG